MNRTSSERFTFLGALVALAALSSALDAQLTIVRDFRGGTPPSTVVGAGDLETIFEAATDYWEGVFLGPAHTLTLSCEWGPTTGERATHQLLTQGGIPNRETAGKIVVDNDGSTPWFADPTPVDHTEFPTLTVASANLGGGILNVERSFAADAGSTAAAGFDLFTDLLHEIGHALGMSLANASYQVEALDGTIDVVAPRPYPGTTVPLDPSSAHTTLAGALMSALTGPTHPPGVRRLPSDADIVAIAELAGYDDTSLGNPSAAVVLRNGSGLNPLYYSQLSPAIIGSNWVTSITMVGHLLSAILVGTGPAQVGTSWGELLCATPVRTLHVTGTPLHSIPVPADVGLIGRVFYTQGVTYLSQAGFNFPPRLTNALDVRIGAY